MAAAEAKATAEYFGMSDNTAVYPAWTAKVVGAEALNMRRTPNGKVMKVVYAVTVIGEEKDIDGDIWYKIRLGDGTVGYVWPKYLSK